jgi:hypothetical protein
MNELKMKPINHTVALEDAMIAVIEAKEGRGLYIRLLSRPDDIGEVRDAISRYGAGFGRNSVFLTGINGPTPAEMEINAAQNLVLICNLLIEHLKAGN